MPVSVASISEKYHRGMVSLQSGFSNQPLFQPIRALQSVLLFGAQFVKPFSDTIDRLVPEPVFQLLTNVMGTDLHAHEGGSADRSFLRYSLIKGILKGGITKLVIKPSPTSDFRVVRLEDEIDKETGKVIKSDLTILKEKFINERYSGQNSSEANEAFYAQYITDKIYLAQQLKK